jgi:hypothetical protein
MVCFRWKNVSVSVVRRSRSKKTKKLAKDTRIIGAERYSSTEKGCRNTRRTDTVALPEKGYIHTVYRSTGLGEIQLRGKI